MATLLFISDDGDNAAQHDILATSLKLQGHEVHLFRGVDAFCAERAKEASKFETAELIVAYVRDIGNPATTLDIVRRIQESAGRLPIISFSNEGETYGVFRDYGAHISGIRTVGDFAQEALPHMHQYIPCPPYGPLHDAVIGGPDC